MFPRNSSGPPGPKAERLKLKDNWRDLVKKSLSKKKNQEIFARYMNDPDFAKVVAEFLRKQVYQKPRRSGLSPGR